VLSVKMPPFLPRKRLASTPPPASSRGSPAKKARLADALDSPSKSILAKRFTLGDDTDSTSSLSDVDSEVFEDVPSKSNPQQNEEGESDEDVDWEDATKEAEPAHVPMAGGDIQLTFRKDDEGPDYAQQAAAGGKKGPTKRERETRLLTHTLHVQFLMHHNAIRNRWICDKQVQEALVEQLPAQIKDEVRKWKVKSGLVAPESKQSKSSNIKKGKNRSDTKNVRKERDWTQSSERLEPGKPDLSNGDPLIHLMKVLSGYWRKRFAITAPGLRKRGYGSKLQLKNTIASYRNDMHDPEQHGERVRNLEEFRQLAKGNSGSRDIGAQLFTALCRGLGIDARMVANLQPSGFGWSKSEQSTAKKAGSTASDEDSDTTSGEDTGPSARAKAKPQVKGKSKVSAKTPDDLIGSTPGAPKATATKTPTRRAKGKGDKKAPIDLDSDGEDAMIAEDSYSVIDITPSTLKQQPQLYDRDLPFPIYWTEAISPIDYKVLPVSPLVVNRDHCVATTPDHLAYFEPRGAKAERAKQVMAYVIAHSQDGTAKDVTTRYLKRRTWPGKTKGMRIPVEKVPIYDKNGKIKRYEEYDWFKHIMMGYARSDDMLTEIDVVEDTSDLISQQPQKKSKEDEGDTLSNLKTSSEWVLERHLRREEALLPGAKPDRVFISGKPKTASYKKEDVYRRADVVKCQTAETWHKFGRIPIAGEAPLKHVPVRAVTLTRKREVEDHLKQTGEKLMQGLYSEAQTEYIIPPPIKDGVIPKNSYNNIDCFVESMVPEGAVHLPMKGLKRICNKLEIDFAEAVVGFEFGNKMAVPIIKGVVIAEENEGAVRDAWKTWAEEQRIKEESKIEKQALDMWRKMLMGLRIRERVADEYGGFEIGDDAIPNAKGKTADEPIDVDQEEAGIAGGFNPDDDEEMGGGFLIPHSDEEEDTELILEHHDAVEVKSKGKQKEAAGYPTPDSVLSSGKGKGKAKKSLLQYDGADEEDSEGSAASPVTETEDSEDDASDDFEIPKTKPKGAVVTPKRTRRSLRGETSPYF
jgi:xeroderma pigmentosum group C-complementing protein